MRTRCARPVVKALAVLWAASILSASAPARAEPPPRPAARTPTPHLSYTTPSPAVGETGAPPVPSAPQLWPAPAPRTGPFEPKWPLVTGYALSVLAAIGWLFYGRRRRA